MALPESERQPVLDEAAGMIMQKKNTHAPVRNKVTYFQSLCRLAAQGELIPTSASEKMRERRETMDAVERSHAEAEARLEEKMRKLDDQENP